MRELCSSLISGRQMLWTQDVAPTGFPQSEFHIHSPCSRLWNRHTLPVTVTERPTQLICPRALSITSTLPLLQKPSKDYENGYWPRTPLKARICNNTLLWLSFALIDLKRRHMSVPARGPRNRMMCFANGEPRRYPGRIFLLRSSKDLECVARQRLFK